MAYYLAVERVPESYEAINIKKTTKGKQLFNPDEGYECTLEEIDRFTTEYDHLHSLKHTLYSERKIPWNNSSLAIAHLNGEKLTITQDILLSPSKKYLEKPNLVIEYLINEFSAYNTILAKELLENLPESKTKTMLETLIKMMEESIEYDIPLELTGLIHIAQLLVYQTDESEMLTKPISFDYQKLHNVVVAIAKYENKIKQDKQSYQRSKTKNT